jgi:hypothetical protein
MHLRKVNNNIPNSTAKEVRRQRGGKRPPSPPSLDNKANMVIANDDQLPTPRRLENGPNFKLACKNLFFIY